MIMLTTLADTVLARLAWTSVQAIVLIAALGLIARCVPRMPAATRAVLWWLVALQLLLGLFWQSPLNVPLLAPATPMAAIAPPPLLPATWPVSATPLSPTTTDAALWAPQTLSAPWLWLHWQALLLLLWAFVVLAQALFAIRQWLAAQALRRASTPIDDPDLHALYTQQMATCGLRRMPRLRMSDAITSPQVMGALRPTILLPVQHALTADEAAMALSHELAHLQRGDLWLGWIPAIAQRLFFFHPLVAWAMREYAFHREAACDAQVMQQLDAAPQTYGRLLLRLGVAHPLHAGLAGASPNFRNLKRRLLMLQKAVNHNTKRSRGWVVIIAIAMLGVLPYRVTASAATQTATQASTTDTSAGIPLPPPLPTPPAPPAPPLPPPPPADPFGDDHGGIGHHTDIDINSHATTGVALFDGNDTIVNGDERDISMVKQLRQGSGAMVWFRRGDKGYVIRDSAYVQRAKAIYQPMREFGKQQGQLGEQQGRLGGKQAALGARQGALGIRIGELANQQALVSAQSATANDDAPLKAQTAKLEAEQAQISRQQNALSQQQDELGKQQEMLGKQQEQLGTRQEQAMQQASQQMDALISEALAKGVAQPVSLR